MYSLSSFSANHQLLGLYMETLDQNTLKSVGGFPLSAMSFVSDTRDFNLC